MGSSSEKDWFFNFKGQDGPLPPGVRGWYGPYHVVQDLLLGHNDEIRFLTFTYRWKPGDERRILDEFWEKDLRTSLLNESST
jgi:hypothetical protein